MYLKTNATLLSCVMFMTIEWVSAKTLVLMGGKDKQFVSKMSKNITGTIHAIVTVYYAIWILGDNEFWLNRVTHTTDLSTHLACTSLGYFIYDVIVLLYNYRSYDAIFFVHGISALVVNYMILVSGLGHFYWAASIMWEVSTPFVHIRFLMLKLGIERFKKINNVILVGTFFSARIVWGLYFKYLIWDDMLFNGYDVMVNQHPIIFYGVWGQIMFGHVLDALNLYWFYLIINKLFGLSLRV